jgi:hypothetical protein
MHTLNKIILPLFLTAIFFFAISKLFASEKDSTQSNKAGEYSLVLYAGGGLSKYVGNPGVAKTIQTELTNFGFSGTLRIMWHPDHLLRLGIETGQVSFYSYTIKNNDKSGELKLSAVPILLEWSMPINKRFNVFLGYGIYLLTSKLDYAGETISSTSSMGYLVALNYIQPLSDHLGIAGEIKYLGATETKDDIMNLQVQFVWKFLKW